jgi:hypothetical protein
VSFRLPAFLALADLQQRRLLAHQVGHELPHLGAGPLAPVDPARRHRLAVSLALERALCVSPAPFLLEHFRIQSDRLPVQVVYFLSYRRQFAAPLREPLSARQLAHYLSLLDLFTSCRPYSFHAPAS